MCYSKIKNAPMEALRAKVHQDLDRWFDNILDPHAEEGQVLQSTEEFQHQITEDVLDTVDVILQNGNADSTPLPADVRRRLQSSIQGHSGRFPEDVALGVLEAKGTFGNKDQVAESRKELSKENAVESFWEKVKRFFKDMLQRVQKWCQEKLASGSPMGFLWEALQEVCSFLMGQL